MQLKQIVVWNRLHADAGTAQGVPPPHTLFWQIHYLFLLKKTRSVFYKKVHYIILCDLLGNAAISDLSILIQFSLLRVFSYKHGQMRQFVVR